MTKIAAKIFLLWGHASTPLPPALSDAVDRGQARVEVVGSLYALAAQLMAQGSLARAVFVDPGQLMPRVAEALAVFQRYALVPMIILPLPPDASASVKQFSHPILLKWEAAASLLTRLLPAPVAAADDAEGSAPPANQANSLPTGNPVTSPLHARYDEFDSQPLLSEEEMRALLGARE